MEEGGGKRNNGILECWRNGVLEEWNVGRMEKDKPA
jgi:hypothetical protein